MGITGYQWACMLGLPALISALVSILVKFIYEKLKGKRDESDSLKLGIQALLRAQMIADYNKWTAKGYAPIYARDNFDNCHKQYAALGANGVMDDIYVKFMALPTEINN